MPFPPSLRRYPSTFLSLVALPLLFLRGSAQSLEDPKYVTYTDPQSLVQTDYPSGLLQRWKEGVFTSKELQASLIVRVSIDQSGPTWQQVVKKLVEPDLNKKVTYQVVKDHFAVASGYWGSGDNLIFYTKEIPIIADGRRMILYFHMLFPRNKKELFDPILEHCERSFKPAENSDAHRISVGWKGTEETQKSEVLVDRAQDWIRADLKCKQLGDDNDDRKDPPSGSCSIEANEPEMFDLTDTGKVQFVLTAYGPIQPYQYGSWADQKFILFTFSGKNMVAQVIHEEGKEDTFTGYSEGVKILEFPSGKKVLSLIVERYSCGESGHLFMDTGGKIEEVLDFEKTVNPCRASQQIGGQGFDSVLELIDERHIRLLKRNYENIASDEAVSVPGKFHYSEIRYQYDTKRKKFNTIGSEKDLPKGSAEKNWKEKSEGIGLQN